MEENNFTSLLELLEKEDIVRIFSGSSFFGFAFVNKKQSQDFLVYRDLPYIPPALAVGSCQLSSAHETSDIEDLLKLASVEPPAEICEIVDFFWRGYRCIVELVGTIGGKKYHFLASKDFASVR